MALKNVAQSPFIADAEAVAARWVTVVRRVPLKYWRMAVLGLALIWITHNLAALVWYIAPTPDLPVGEVTPKTGRLAAVTGRSVDVAAIQMLDLFGNVATQPAEPILEQQPQLERTRLNIQLQGIIAASDAGRSWAIIGPGETQKLYKVGDPIDGASGVKLAEIQSLKVIINNNGKLEELWLYGEDGMNVASSSYTPPPRDTGPAPEASTAISREQISQAQNIGDVVRFMVATENGRMIGYKVRPGRKRELFDMVGLKNDDIVVSVNGIEVNEPQKVREVYQALKNATEANLQVLRDGATHSIQITMSSEG